MEWSQRKEQLGAVREGLVIVGLLVAGGWAIFKFIETESPEARLQYENQLYQSRTYGLQMSVTAESIAGPSCMIVGSVRVKNVGASAARLSLVSGPPITIARVSVQDDGHIIDRDSVRRFWIDDVDHSPLRFISIVPGREIQIPYAGTVNSPGVYWVRFRVPAVFGDPRRPQFTNNWSERTLVRACGG